MVSIKTDQPAYHVRPTDSETHSNPKTKGDTHPWDGNHFEHLGVQNNGSYSTPVDSTKHVTLPDQNPSYPELELGKEMSARKKGTMNATRRYQLKIPDSGKVQITVSAVSSSGLYKPELVLERPQAIDQDTWDKWLEDIHCNSQQKTEVVREKKPVGSIDNVFTTYELDFNKLKSRPKRIVVYSRLYTERKARQVGPDSHTIKAEELK